LVARVAEDDGLGHVSIRVSRTAIRSTMRRSRSSGGFRSARGARGRRRLHSTPNGLGYVFDTGVQSDCFERQGPERGHPGGRREKSSSARPLRGASALSPSASDNRPVCFAVCPASRTASSTRAKPKASCSAARSSSTTTWGTPSESGTSGSSIKRGTKCSFRAGFRAAPELLLLRLPKSIRPNGRQRPDARWNSAFFTTPRGDLERRRELARHREPLGSRSSAKLGRFRQRGREPRCESATAARLSSTRSSTPYR
jgi:hypothetical protein